MSTVHHKEGENIFWESLQIKVKKYTLLPSYPCKYWHFVPVPPASLPDHLKTKKIQDSFYNHETKV